MCQISVHQQSPECPTCGEVAIAPTRTGMSATPFQCAVCGHRFAFTFAMCDVSQLAGKTSSMEAILRNVTTRVEV